MGWGGGLRKGGWWVGSGMGSVEKVGVVVVGWVDVGWVDDMARDIPLLERALLLGHGRGGAEWLWVEIWGSEQWRMSGQRNEGLLSVGTRLATSLDGLQRVRHLSIAELGRSICFGMRELVGRGT